MRKQQKDAAGAGPAKDTGRRAASIFKATRYLQVGRPGYSVHPHLTKPSELLSPGPQDREPEPGRSSMPRMHDEITISPFVHRSDKTCVLA